MKRRLVRMFVRGVGSAAVLLASGVSLAAPAASKPQRTPHPAPVSRYAGYVRTWHAPDPDASPPTDGHGRPELALYSLNTRDRVTLAAASDSGGFSAPDLDRAAYVLRDARSGNEHPVEPRLLDLVYRIQTHFQAQEIRVVSGYRTPTRRGGSNHGKGRAIDLVVPGAADADVAAYARSLGFVGVGIYPTSGFVHVDVRAQSYYWIDQSAPGRRNRERGILGELAKASDRDAQARGDRPVRAWGTTFDVDAVLKALPSAPAPAPEEDDDDDSSSSAATPAPTTSGATAP